MGSFFAGGANFMLRCMVIFEVGFILRWCLSAGQVETGNVNNHVQQCDVMYCAVMKCTLP